MRRDGSHGDGRRDEVGPVGAESGISLDSLDFSVPPQLLPNRKLLENAETSPMSDTDVVVHVERFSWPSSYSSLDTSRPAAI